MADSAILLSYLYEYGCECLSSSNVPSGESKTQIVDRLDGNDVPQVIDWLDFSANAWSCLLQADAQEHRPYERCDLLS